MLRSMCWHDVIDGLVKNYFIFLKFFKIEQFPSKKNSSFLLRTLKKMKKFLQKVEQSWKNMCRNYWNTKIHVQYDSQTEAQQTEGRQTFGQSKIQPKKMLNILNYMCITNGPNLLVT